MKPPKRQRKAVTVIQSSTEPQRCRWSLEEKKQLIAALKRFHMTDISSIHRLLPSRSEVEVAEKINSITKRANKLEVVRQEDEKAVSHTQFWCNHAEEILSAQVDYSQVLSQIFLAIGNLEQSCSQRKNRPNFGALYKYIAVLFNPELELPELQPLDAAILLEQIDQLQHTIPSEGQMSILLKRKRLLLLKQLAVNADSKSTPNADSDEETSDMLDDDDDVTNLNATNTHEEAAVSDNRGLDKLFSDHKLLHDTMFSLNPFCIPLRQVKCSGQKHKK